MTHRASQSFTDYSVRRDFTASQHFTKSAVKLASCCSAYTYLLHSRVCEVAFVKCVSCSAARLHTSHLLYPLKGVYFISVKHPLGGLISETVTVLREVLRIIVRNCRFWLTLKTERNPGLRASEILREKQQQQQGERDER